MTSEQASTGVAVIGAGYWGKSLVRNFAQLGALAAVVDSDSARRQVMAEAYPQAAIYEDMYQVLADDNIPAVAISTPAETHSALVVRCLNRGKHVFVEKPLCLEVLRAASWCDGPRKRAWC